MKIAQNLTTVLTWGGGGGEEGGGAFYSNTNVLIGLNCWSHTAQQREAGCFL